MEAALRELEELLPGNNYLVDFQLYHVPFDPDWSSGQYIIAAIGAKPPLTKLEAITAADLLAEVESYLCYDRGQYRGYEVRVHSSPRFAELVAQVRSELERFAETSTSIVRFWRDDWIEWQFSYLFVRPAGAVVFTGWGSD